MVARSVCLLLALCAAACTPMRSTKPPPYLFQNVTYHEEQGMQEAAMAFCVAQDPEDARPEPSFAFTTDGCSMSPDGIWGACCLAHDVRYWCAGTREDRLRADRELRMCVAALEKPAIAQILYIGTRLGGWRRTPFGWRWGYGYRWPAPRSSSATPP